MPPPSPPSTAADHASAAAVSRLRFDPIPLVFWITALFLWSLVLSGPLRYTLAAVHIGILIYVPKLLLLIILILLPMMRPKASPAALVASAIVLAYLLWGMVNLAAPLQAMFGLWVLVPLLYGLWIGPLTDIAQWRRLVSALFCVTILGVCVNPLIHFPWSGQFDLLLGHTIEVSRQWTALGFQRYAGFARASFNAATQLLLFGLLLLMLLERRSAKLLVWLLSGSAIALTTSKGPFGVWLLLSLYFVPGQLFSWPRYWLNLWFTALALILASMILLPLSTLCIKYDPSLHLFITQFLFASFGDRLNWMWPDSLHLLNIGGSYHWLVGRGLGGIGAAQQYFNPTRFLAGDNLFVYMTVVFGLPLSLYLLAAALFRTYSITRRAPTPRSTLPLLLGLAAYGIVANLLEGALASLFLGMALSNPGLFCCHRNPNRSPTPLSSTVPPDVDKIG